MNAQPRSLTDLALKKARAAHAAWNQYFFAEAALNSLCLYRIVFCFIILTDAIGWLPYTEELFSTEGFHTRYSFFSAYMNPLEARVFCVLLAVTSFFACIGYFTRLNLFFTLLFYAMLHSVDAINEKAIETIVLVVLTVLLFSPCGSMFSLDVWIGRVAKRTRGVVFPQRLLQFEFAQIYFFCGLTKMMVPEWPSGKVFIDSLSGRWASDLGVWFAGWVPDWMGRAFGFGTVLFELFVAPLLLTKPLRWLAVAAALSFHLGIECLLDIGSLGLHFMAADFFLFFNADRFAASQAALTSWLQNAAAQLKQKFVQGTSRLPNPLQAENEVFG